ncbi:MAG TPA: hypothetical protein VK831_04850 [Candidatus Deferrimicrobiaceae bacterium]|nr:hypothetical protein [Candidatus Deferrimicrobiaceae bacterium]
MIRRVAGGAPRSAYVVVALIVGVVALAVLGREPAPLPTAAPSPTERASAIGPEPPASGATITPTVLVAIVPVTGLGGPWTTTGPAEAEAAISGTSDRYRALEVVTADATAVLEAIGVAETRAGIRLVLARDAASLIDDLARQPDRLAFLRADDLERSVRVLGWGDHQLFDADGVPDWAAWPLWIVVPDAGPPASPTS